MMTGSINPINVCVTHLQTFKVEEQRKKVKAKEEKSTERQYI